MGPLLPNPASGRMHHCLPRLAPEGLLKFRHIQMCIRDSTYTAVNLHPKWMNFPLQKELEKRWKKPVRVANDASIQGYGVVRGKGVELTLTLGTGMGSALFTDGRLCPGLELGHHPWKTKTYELSLIHILKRDGIPRAKWPGPPALPSAARST